MFLLKYSHCVLLLYLQMQYFGGTTALYNTDEQLYIENVENLTSVAELTEFFNAQCSIYVDNVYGVYEKFFHRLLGELPRSERTKQIKQLLPMLEQLLELEDVRKKMQLHDYLLGEYHNTFESLFEYDPVETRLSATDFNDLYVRNDIDDVLNYAEDTQIREFMQHTGNGIRIYLIFNRPRLSQTQIYEIKTIVDAYLEEETFMGKRLWLHTFLQKCREFLE